MVMHYLMQVGLFLALTAILVVSWLLTRRTRGNAGTWLRFLGMLLLVLVRLTDIVLFDPFIGILRPDATNGLAGLETWSLVFSVGARAGFVIFAVGEVILYCSGGHRRPAEGTD